jgi:hypothetical protein
VHAQDCEAQHVPLKLVFQKSIEISGGFDNTLAQRKAFCKMFFGGVESRKFVF